MANPTTAFGWVMPTTTDLVTDLPADFAVFGQGVDTSMQYLLGGTTGQVLSKTSGTNMAFTWTTPTDQVPLTTKGDIFTFTTVDARLAVGTNKYVLGADSAQATGLAWQTSPQSIMTTTGDTLYASAANTPARLGIGSASQVLTVSGGIPAWVTPASATASWSLLNTTTTTSGASKSVTGLSGYNQFMITFDGISLAGANNIMQLTFNADTSAIYNRFGVDITEVLPVLTGSRSLLDTYVNLCTLNAAENVKGFMFVQGGNSAGIKVGTFQMQNNNPTSGDIGRISNFYYTGTAVISSIEIKTPSTFDLGSFQIYGSVV